MPTSQNFMGVAQSLNGRRWRLRDVDETLSRDISQRHRLPEVVGRLLASRGVTLDAVEDFLEPTLKRLLPDPSSLQDMDKAAQRLAEAVMAVETIGVFGDYDVDGATSSAVLAQYFKALDIEVLVHIPDRSLEGYGPNAPALLALQERGAKVAITVDCGITAYEPLAAVAAAGFPVIVCDHHQAETQLPEAFAVVNPKRLDDSSGQGHLAAVGVAFLLCVAVNRCLRQAGWFSEGRHAEPDLRKLLDVVALGTVCDVVPLQGVNRAFVSQGLRLLSKARREGNGNTGMLALADVCGLEDDLDAYHLGYVLGPRVNAGGRVGKSPLGAQLLSTDDLAEARAIATELNEFNGLRQQVEADVLLQAMEQVESTANPEEGLVFALGKDWHAGVIGIVAGRLRERYDLPALVATDDGGVIKGSGRGVPGLDLGKAILAARDEGLLMKGGGHAMAAGFTLAPEKVSAFRAFLSETLRQQLAGEALIPEIMLDGAVDVGGVNWSLLQTIARAGPFGAGNPEPRFVVPDCRIARVDIVGMGHVRCVLRGPRGGNLKAIAFKAADSEMGFKLLNSNGAALHLAGTLRADTWNGRQDAQLVIEDAAEA